MKSQKELQLEKKLLSLMDKDSLCHRLAGLLVDDKEIQRLQDYANVVAIKRLGFNDHGPVHMRQVALNALTMLSLLRDAGVMTSLEEEGTGGWDESACAVLLAGFLHDLGMSIARTDHELTGMLIARPIMARLLEKLCPEDTDKQISILSLATEGILGHMATRKIHSVEAGLILVADGCDMESGRARIPLIIGHDSPDAKVGDIHKYSAAAIKRVTISKGNRHPIKIEVEMTSDVGLFQIEEVLLPKISMSPDKGYLEVFASVIGKMRKEYL